MRFPAVKGLVGAALCASAALVLAQATSGAAERGQKLYMEKYCFTCHGTVGQGGERGTGPQIAPSQWPFEAFAQQVRHPRQDMPRYPAKYASDEELKDIHAYLVAIKPGRAAKDIDLLSQAP